MEEKIFEILKGFEKINEKNILEIISILIDYYGIRDYLVKIIIKDSYDINSVAAYYSYIDKEIYINQNIAHSSNLSYNVNILKNIFHEIEHILQYKNLIQGNYDDLKKMLLEDIIGDIIRNDLDEEKINLDNSVLYNYNASERMAEIDCLIKLENITRLYKNPMLDKIINANIEARKKIGYNNNCPIVNYYINLELLSDYFFKEEILNKLNKSLQFYNSVNDKIYYGLPRNDEEYQKSKIFK